MYRSRNRILCADAYTVSSFNLVSPEMRQRSAYHIVFRCFETPPGLEGLGEGKLVFHGLTGILQKLLGQPLAREEIEEAREMLATFHFGGTPYPADFAMWEAIAKLGYFPLKIYARRDGAIVNVGEPVAQVVSEPGWGELAAHFESKLVQCWATSARATVMRKWLEYNEGLVRQTTDVTDPAQVRFLAQMQLSDFGDRAASCSEESEVLGMAHLTSHVGIDTLSAAFAAWQASGKRFNGSSIRALAHRVVQGYVEEEEAFRVLFEVAGDGGISSHVADCYNFHHAVVQYLVPLARRAAARGAIVVARPDSGDALEGIRYILEQARQAGHFRTNEKGLVEMTSLRYICADGLDFARIRYAINEPLLAAGYAVPSCGIYGVGGYLRNCLSRDMMGAAMKLCAVGDSLRPAAKFSPGGKASIPGIVKVIQAEGDGPTVFPAQENSDADQPVHIKGAQAYGTVFPAQENSEADYGELKLMYDCGRWTTNFEESQDFLNVRRRVLEDWDGFMPSRRILSSEVKQIMEELRAMHVRSLGRVEK